MSIGFHPIGAAPIAGEVVTAVAGAYTLTATVGTFTLTGVNVGLNFGRLLTVTTGDFTLTGVSVGLNVGFSAAVQTGTFSLTGVDTTLNFGRSVIASTGDFTLTGVDVGLTYAPAGSYSLTATVGTFALTGVDVTLTYTPLNNYVLTATTCDFSLTGNSVVLTWSGAPIEVPTPQGGGRSKRKDKPVVVEIDGQDFVVGSEEEAVALLDQAKEEAQALAKVQIERAAKAEKRKPGKVVADARKTLVVPQIKAPGLEEYAAQILSDIRDSYTSAMRTIEVAALLRKRERDEEDDEEVLMLMM